MSATTGLREHWLVVNAEAFHPDTIDEEARRMVMDICDLSRLGAPRRVVDFGNPTSPAEELVWIEPMADQSAPGRRKYLYFTVGAE